MALIWLYGIFWALNLANTAYALEPHSFSRPGYGTTFSFSGKLLPIKQSWTHTYQFEVPPFEYIPIPLLNCSHDISVCTAHNVMARLINSIAFTIDKEVSLIYLETAQLLGHARLQPTPQGNLASRSKRAVLSFVGDIASNLFGVATTGQVRMLANHINNIIKNQNKLAGRTFANAGRFISYMHKTNRRIHNLVEMTNMNHNILKNVTALMRREARQTAELIKDATKMFNLFMRRSHSAHTIHRHLNDFRIGIHELAQRRLSPSLVPVGLLQSTLKNVRQELKFNHPLLKVATEHAAFYYQDTQVYFMFQNTSVFVTIQIPLTSNPQLFDLYRVRSLPVPFNHSTAHVTSITNLPDFFAISQDQQSFMELSSTDIMQCPGAPIRRCPVPTAERLMDNPTCAASLFLDTNKKTTCDVTVREDGLLSTIIPVSPAKVLLSGIPDFIYTCNGKVIKKPGCTFCEVEIPCGCSLATDNFQMDPRLTDCPLDGPRTPTVRYPVNLALLHEFFEAPEIDHINPSSLFQNLPPITLPHLDIMDSTYNKDVQKDRKLEADLSTVAKAMKQGKPVSRIRPWESEIVLEDPYFSWPHILAYTALGITIVLLVLMFILFKRLRTLCLVVAMMSSQNPALTAVKAQGTIVPSQSPRGSTTHMQTHLVWDSNTPQLPVNIPTKMGQTAQEATAYDTPNPFLLGLELFSLTLLLIVLLKYGYAKILIIRHTSEVYLELTDGTTFQDVYLITLTFCPTEYTLTLPCWATAISILKRRMGPNDLLITWSQFGISENPTRQYIAFPKTIHLTYWQARRLTRILAAPYCCYIKIMHAGRAFYITLAPDTPSTTNHTIARSHTP